MTTREAAVRQDVPKGSVHQRTLAARPGDARLSVEDPATGEVLGEVADAAPDDGRDTLDAAVEARPAWAAHPARDRGVILRRAFELIRAHQADLALRMTLEMGKPLAESRTEVSYAAEFFRWFAEEAVRIDGRYAVTPDGRGQMLVMRQPVGSALLITPWNFPLAMGTRKIGPAVAAGCTMVVKPVSLTPLSMLALADILREAGLPDGVLNVVTTSRSGTVMEPLIRSGSVRKLSFTGSTEVGRRLEQCADQVVRVTIELGGNAPFVVFDDADIGAAVDGAMVAKDAQHRGRRAPRPTGSTCIPTSPPSCCKAGRANGRTDRRPGRRRARPCRAADRWCRT